MELVLTAVIIHSQSENRVTHYLPIPSPKSSSGSCSPQLPVSILTTNLSSQGKGQCTSLGFGCMEKWRKINTWVF